jgi:DNA-binding transcriptional MerR regulator
MRISELSRQTGVPIPTIKFYLRERLLPPGEVTGRNQAQYGDCHRRRLRFIRALTDIGQLDLSSVRLLLSAIEDECVPTSDLLEIVYRMLFPGGSTQDDNAETRQAQIDVGKFIGSLGWQVHSDAPGHARLVQVLAAMRRLGCDCGADFFAPYAEVAERLAVRQLDLVEANHDVDRAGAVARAVLLDGALSALLSMAQDHHVALRFGRPTADPGPG